MLSVSNYPVLLDTVSFRPIHYEIGMAALVIGFLIYILVIVLLITFISFNKKDKEERKKVGKRYWLIIGVPLITLVAVWVIYEFSIIYPEYVDVKENYVDPDLIERGNEWLDLN